MAPMIDDVEIIEGPVPTHRRSTDDISDVITASLLTGIALAVSRYVPAGLAGFEQDLLDAVRRLPTWLRSPLVNVTQIVASLVPIATTIYLLIRRRLRRAGLVWISLIAASQTMRVVQRLLDVRDVRPIRLGEPLRGLSMIEAFPTSTYVAAVTALVVVESPWLTLRWRRAARLGIAVMLVTRLVSGQALPVDAAVALTVGWLVGSIVLLTFGSPNLQVRATDVVAALRELGHRPRRVEAIRRGAFSNPAFSVSLRDGTAQHIKIVGDEERDLALPIRVYRWLRVRNLGDDAPIASRDRLVDHQGFAALSAHVAGVRTPELLGVADVTPDATMLVFRAVPGRRLDRLAAGDFDRDLLSGVFDIALQLERRRIAHRHLDLTNLLVDRSNQVNVVDFGRAQLGAPEKVLAQDRAELLAAMASKVGVDRAVDVAAETYGDERLESVLPLLQPLALSSSTRSAIKAAEGLDALDAAVRARTGADAVKLAPIERFRPRTVVMTAVTAVAALAIIPQLTGMTKFWPELRSANWWWGAAAIGFSALTYIGAAMAIRGAVPANVPFTTTLAAQVAGSFTAIAAPAGIGVMGTNIRYLQRQGVDPAVATAAVGVNTVVAFAMHASLLTAFSIWTGNSSADSIALPSGRTALIVAGVILVAVGAGVALPATRRLLRVRILPVVRRAASGVAAVARRPVKVAELFGGAALVTLGYILALVVSIEAFGGGLAIPAVAVVYLAASVVATAAPTPGGLGAVEAALIAGLTAAGLSGERALAATLTFRLATFWLPIPPGWFALNRLQRADAI